MLYDIRRRIQTIFLSKFEADNFSRRFLKMVFVCTNDEKSYYQAIKIETTKTMLNYLVISAAVSHRSRAFDGSAARNLTSN